jgi:hypothetical protein
LADRALLSKTALGSALAEFAYSFGDSSQPCLAGPGSFDREDNTLLGTRGQPCIGYLDHPFKNKPFETEKDLLRLLANTGGLVYNPKSSTAYSCSTDDTRT